MAGLISASTATALAAGASIAGTGASVAGKLKGGAAQRGANDAAAAQAAAVASYQAVVARNNAKIAEQNAEAAVKSGVTKASNTSLRNAAVGGKLKAGQAASGVDVNTGTAVDVRVGQREAAVLDAETVLHNSQLQAYGFHTQAANFEAEANLQDSKANFARASVGAGGDYGAGLGAAGSLLAGASAIPWKWIGGLGADGEATGAGSTEGMTNTPLAPGGSRQSNYGE